MNQNALCPVYKKWLHKNVHNARLHRTQMLQQAQGLCKNGDFQAASSVCSCAYEIAKIVLLTPFATEEDQSHIRQDYFTYVTLCIYLSGIFERTGDLLQSSELLSDCQKQLLALLPLHALLPQNCEVISKLLHVVEQAENQSKYSVNTSCIH